MKFPFIDLNTQYKRLEDEIKSRAIGVLESGQYINGPAVTELEGMLAEHTGVKHAIGCANGTDALLMVLMAWGIGSGDAVFAPPFTFVATAEVISLTGATVVFVDIDEKSFNIDPSRLSVEIDRVKSEGRLKPKALITVDLFGLPADYDSLSEITDREGLLTLEDAAQGFGGEYKGKRAGSLGDAGATSFFPAKPLGAYGDAGAIFTDDENLAQKLVSVREHGMDMGERYLHPRLGLNARLDTMQAAMLIPKLSIFPEELIERDRLAKRYNEGLNGLLITPHIPDGYKSAWAQYTIVTDERDKLRQSLIDNGVPCAVYYPKPLHLQEAYSGLGYNQGDFPVSEKASKTVLSLPMSPYLKEEDQDYVIKTIKERLG